MTVEREDSETKPGRTKGIAFGLVALASLGAGAMGWFLTRTEEPLPPASEPLPASTAPDQTLPQPDSSTGSPPEPAAELPTSPTTADLQASRRYRSKGAVKATTGDHQGAIAEFSRAIEANPRFVRAFYGRALSNKALGDVEGAIADFTQALECDDGHAKSYFQRGLLRRESGDPKGAIADFTRVIAIERPRSAEAYFQRGRAQFERYSSEKRPADLRAAERDYSRAIEINRRHAKAYRARGQARHAQGSPRNAVEDLDQAIDLNPLDAEALASRGKAYKALGKHVKAAKDFQAALKLDPTLVGRLAPGIQAYVKQSLAHAKAYAANVRGADRNRVGDTDGAIKEFTKAIELDPRFAAAYLNRGGAWKKKGEHAKAAQDFRDGLAFDPDYVTVFDFDVNAYIEKHAPR